MPHRRVMTHDRPPTPTHRARAIEIFHPKSAKKFQKSRAISRTSPPRARARGRVDIFLSHLALRRVAVEAYPALIVCARDATPATASVFHVVVVVVSRAVRAPRRVIGRIIRSALIIRDITRWARIIRSIARFAHRPRSSVRRSSSSSSSSPHHARASPRIRPRRHPHARARVHPCARRTAPSGTPARIRASGRPGVRSSTR